MLGQEIKTLVNQEHSAGVYSVEWDGTDSHNRTVASGVYLYKIESISSDNNRYVGVKKMVLLK
jgi:flagellar hook assembly protein FlgD